MHRCHCSGLDCEDAAAATIALRATLLRPSHSHFDDDPRHLDPSFLLFFFASHGANCGRIGLGFRVCPVRAWHYRSRTPTDANHSSRTRRGVL